METETSESSDYNQSSPSTKEANQYSYSELTPTYDIDPGTGKSTGSADYDTSKPTRIKFLVKRIE